MKTGISRRAALRGIGQTAAIGSLAAVLSPQLFAAQPATKAPAGKAPAAAMKAPPRAAPAKPKPLTNICLSMIYPAGEGLTFDADAFRERHIAVLNTAYAGGLERVELRVPPPAVAGRAPAPVLAAVSMWISDFGKFAAGAGAHAKEVAASMATITKSAPIAQFDTVLAGLGAARDTVVVGSSCVSYWIEAKEGVVWDGKAFAETYLPKVAAAYGPEAIRRIEVAKGEQSANGSKPLMLGAVTMYIADESAYDKAEATDAVKQVAAEAGQYFTTPPIQTLMLVHAVG